MPTPSLVVSLRAFDRMLERLIANFDPYLEADRLSALADEYARLFRCNKVAEEPGDAVLHKAVDKLIDHRTERGMPRVAEFRQVLDAERDLDAQYRSTERVVAEINRLARAADERNGRG